MSTHIATIKKLSKSLSAELIKHRRHLHAHPELSFKEIKTGKYIQQVLKKYKVPFTGGWAENGVVATIVGGLGKGKTIALRADMDALPITELNKVKYKSKNEGIMHACGHDVHSSSLLGTCIILNKLKKEFAGTIKCIFQPGEEKIPGGASILIKEGVLKNPKPKSILGQHVHPPLETGNVGIRAGQYMASADEIYIKVIGKGGHGALPQNTIDTVHVASQLIVGLQEIISRKKDPFIPSVLSFGKIYSEGGATNVIPDVVRIEGTFRSMNEKWRSKAHKLITSNAKKMAAALGAKVEIEILVGYPYLHNDEDYTAQMKSDMIAYMGKKNVIDLPQRMTSEDFAFYSHEVPACFYRLGTGNKKKGITSPVHTPTFNVDERCLEIGAGLMSYLAIQSLSHKYYL